MNIAYIIDDHRLFASSFSRLLEQTDLFERITVVTQFSELGSLKPATPGQTEFFFMDYLMPGVVTSTEIKSLRIKRPDARIIMVSSITNAITVIGALKAGADAWLTKNAWPDEVKHAITEVMECKTYVSRDIATQVVYGVLQKKSRLFTDRELELLPYLVRGETIDKTAELTNLSRHTIVNHRRNMMEKAGVKSVTALVKVVMEMGLA